MHVTSIRKTFVDVFDVLEVVVIYFILLLLLFSKLFSKSFFKKSVKFAQNLLIYAQNLLKPHPNFPVENLLSLACTAGNWKLHVSPNIKLLNMLYISYMTRSISTFSKTKWRLRIAKHINLLNF